MSRSGQEKYSDEKEAKTNEIQQEIDNIRLHFFEFVS
jgi:hypothetical protein